MTLFQAYLHDFVKNILRDPPTVLAHEVEFLQECNGSKTDPDRMSSQPLI
jgi:hypothetical protein